MPAIRLKRSVGSAAAFVAVEVAKLLPQEGGPVVEMSCCAVPFAPLSVGGWLVAEASLWPPIALQELPSLTEAESSSPVMDCKRQEQWC